MGNSFFGKKNASPFLVIGHRGYSSRYPENTMAAFEAAAASGADMIELDAAISADGVAVVIHDDTLNRTTNGSGLVWEHTGKELFSLDAGSWFSKEFAGEKIPALFEVLKRFLPRLPVNVEIKPLAANVGGPFDPLFMQVADMVKFFDAYNRVLISCFDDRVLDDVRLHDPDIALAVLDDRPSTLAAALGRVEAVGAVSYNPRALFVRKSLVSGLHKKGIRVLAWEKATGQSQKAIQGAIKKGVDGFFADDIDLALTAADRAKSFGPTRLPARLPTRLKNRLKNRPQS